MEAVEIYLRSFEGVEYVSLLLPKTYEVRFKEQIEPDDEQSVLSKIEDSSKYRFETEWVDNDLFILTLLD